MIAKCEDNRKVTHSEVDKLRKEPCALLRKLQIEKLCSTVYKLHKLTNCAEHIHECPLMAT